MHVHVTVPNGKYSPGRVSDYAKLFMGSEHTFCFNFMQCWRQPLTLLWDNMIGGNISCHKQSELIQSMTKYTGSLVVPHVFDWKSTSLLKWLWCSIYMVTGTTRVWAIKRWFACPRTITNGTVASPSWKCKSLWWWLFGSMRTWRIWRGRFKTPCIWLESPYSGAAIVMFYSYGYRKCEQ